MYTYGGCDIILQISPKYDYIYLNRGFKIVKSGRRYFPDPALGGRSIILLEVGKIIKPK